MYRLETMLRLGWSENIRTENGFIFKILWERQKEEKRREIMKNYIKRRFL